MAAPKQLLEDYMPGLADQVVVGGSGLGINVITATVGANTAITGANLVLAPSNTGVAKAVGAVVHSLRRAPTIVIPMEYGMNATVFGATYRYVTADNSAVYISAVTVSQGNAAGVATRIIVIP